MKNLFKQAGTDAANGFIDSIQKMKNPEFEWQGFKCGVGHEFSIKVSLPMSTKSMIELYEKTRCPLCQSSEIERTETF